MTFTLFLNDSSEIFRELLDTYYPSGASIIDLTFGRGALWSKIFSDPALRSKYQLTACDADPDPKAMVQVLKRNLFTDDYGDLGLHDLALYDPPYLVNRISFDFPGASSNSWAAGGLEKFTANRSVGVFNRRVECLKRKAPTFLRSDGLLFVKIMDPRKDGSLIPHHINIANILRDVFDLVDVGVYMRLGPTTWKIAKHLQNLHGYWMVFDFKGLG